MEPIRTEGKLLKRAKDLQVPVRARGPWVRQAHTAAFRTDPTREPVHERWREESLEP